jgi:acetyl-CoA carboxylase biotin carboxyl carrier protein
MKKKKNLIPLETGEEAKMKEQIDYQELNKIIRLMENKNLSHFEIEKEGLKIKLSRNTVLSEATPGANAQAPLHSEEKEGSEFQEFPPEKEDNNLHYITSPMVGTFYSAPDPSSPPFVEAGEEIKKNQVLCIIEAMKLMNEIESDVEGVLKEILVENGKAVEYGQKLFAIQPLE